MTPNQRERALDAAFGWLRLRTRVGNYVKIYGWSRVVLPDSADQRGALLAVLTRFEQDSGETFLVHDANDRRARLSRLALAEFQLALAHPNQFDPNLGGTRVISESRNINLLVEWARSSQGPRTTFLGTVQERWLDRPAHAATLQRSLELLASTCGCEYLISSHVSDEVSKLGAARPRYEVAPGAGIPYVPWLIVMGPDYIEAIGRPKLEAVGDPTVSWRDEFATIVTSPTPLLYGSPKVRETEERVRRALGLGVFTDSRQQERIGPHYPREYMMGPGAADQTWDAYPGRAGVRVVVSRPGDTPSD